MTEIFHDDYEPLPNLNRYEIIKNLGEGTYGEVKKAYDSYEEKFVAIKYVRLLSKKNGLPKAVFREIESLKVLSESNYIVKLENVFATDTNVCLVMEYIESDLQKIISKSKQSLPRSQLKAFYKMMLNAIHYCHSHHILHRDIKPSSTFFHIVSLSWCYLSLLQQISF
jgi:serine/threonine protein kinase